MCDQNARVAPATTHGCCVPACWSAPSAPRLVGCHGLTPVLSCWLGVPARHRTSSNVPNRESTQPSNPTRGPKCPWNSFGESHVRCHRAGLPAAACRAPTCTRFAHPRPGVHAAHAQARPPLLPPGPRRRTVTLTAPAAPAVRVLYPRHPRDSPRVEHGRWGVARPTPRARTDPAGGAERGPGGRSRPGPGGPSSGDGNTQVAKQ